MLTRTIAAIALFLAASGVSGCKPDRSKPLPLSDAGADMVAEPAGESSGARTPIASGGDGEKAAPAGAADAGDATAKPAAEEPESKAEPGDKPATGGKAAGGSDGKTAGGADGVDEGKTPAVKKPRNVKALPRSWSTRQVTDYMKKQVARGLGAECDHCHDTSDFAVDDNKHKKAARAMMAMTGELNRLYFRGKQVITCFTCHEGKPKPARK